MLGTLSGIRMLLSLLLVVVAVQAALHPSVAWITKEALDALREPSTTIWTLATGVGLIYAPIVAAQFLAGFVEKIVNKAVETRLIIELQRTYLGRRKAEEHANDVSQVLFGSEVSKRGFEVVYKDGWKILAEVISVIVWQITLQPDWIPLMLAAVVPALLVVYGLGPYIERISRDILMLQADLAGATRRENEKRFRASQETIFSKTVWFEVLKWCAASSMSAVMWLSLGIAVAVATVLGWPPLPSSHEIGAIAAFLIQMRLLAKPLSEIGRAYAKWREAYPAILVTYGTR